MVDEAATRKAELEAGRGWHAPCLTRAETARLCREALDAQMQEKEVQRGVERGRELSVGHAMLGYSQAAAMAFDVKTN